MAAVQSHTWTTLNLFSQFSTVSHPNHGYHRPQAPAVAHHHTNNQQPTTTTTPSTTAAATTSYTAPAVISLGEEYTDATLPEHTSYLSLEDEQGEGEGEEEGGFMDWDDDACSTTSSEETESSSIISPSSSRRSSARRSIVPALWHAEHSRLLNIQSAVLENERRVRSRELKFESEVARIKGDLARLKQARTEQAQAARLSWLASNNNNHNPLATATTSSTTSDSGIATPNANKRTSSGQQSTLNAASVARVTGPRGPRPRPVQQPTTTTTTTSSSSRTDSSSQAASSMQIESSSSSSVETAHTEKARPESQVLPMDFSLDLDLTPTLGKFTFEAAAAAVGPDIVEEDHAVTESMLSTHLTEARSARAQERHKRKIEHERIRELSMLLTLGSEVRKWEERLAWSQVRSRGTCSDDMSIIESGGQKEREDAMDTDPDPRFKRLSRSFSVPSRGSFVGPSPSSSSSSSTAADNKKGKVPLPLPSLAASPLWRVSAEMILRRGSRSERPRRPPSVAIPPAATAPASTTQPTTTVASSATSSSSASSNSATLTRPSHVLRGPRERGSANTASSSSSTSPTCSNAVASTSQTGSSSGKRYSIPPPITIPSNSQFCNPTTTVGGASSSSSSSSAGTTVSGQVVADVEPVRGFGERPAHPQSSQGYSSSSGTVTPFYSRSTTPIKPSTLKWAFTADDLARELELEKRKKEGDVEMHSPTSSTSSQESESDDSYKSSSEGGASSSSQPAPPQCVERRGRARFSWRRSLPKDSNNTKEEIPAVPPVLHIGA